MIQSDVNERQDLKQFFSNTWQNNWNLWDFIVLWFVSRFCISMAELLIFRVFPSVFAHYQVWYRIWIFFIGASFILDPEAGFSQAAWRSRVEPEWVCPSVWPFQPCELSLLTWHYYTFLLLKKILTTWTWIKDPFWFQARQNRTVYIIYFCMSVFSAA